MFLSNSPGWVRAGDNGSGGGDTPSAEDWASKRFVVIPEQGEEDDESSDSSLDAIYHKLAIYKGPSLFPNSGSASNQQHNNNNNDSNNIGWNPNNNSWYPSAPQNRQQQQQQNFGAGSGENNFIHPQGGFNNYHAQQQRTVFARTHTGATPFGFPREDIEFEPQGRQPNFANGNLSASKSNAGFPLSAIPYGFGKPNGNNHNNRNHHNPNRDGNHSYSHNGENNHHSYNQNGDYNKVEAFSDMMVEEEEEEGNNPVLPNFTQILGQ